MLERLWKCITGNARWIGGCLAMLAVGWALSPAAQPAWWFRRAEPEPSPSPPPAPNGEILLSDGTQADPATREILLSTPVYQPTAEGSLSGHIIAVDPGHGGYDGGARAANRGLWEKVYNLRIALELKDMLIANGATVVMTRDTDEALNDPNPPGRKKRQDMERRAERVLTHGAEMLLSIHQNDYRVASQHGPQVFYRKDCAAGRELAVLLQTNLNEELYPGSRRRANVGDFYINSLGIPSALVECGFLSNAAEEAKLRDPEYQRRIAQAITQSVIEWFARDNLPQAAAREDR
ncbi:MAG: N-acetylmuramoyl-L-alanine amidase [Oscillospiraceae bacterium]|nr:N-acetylmuramoyl-L-alanine amidase [Oscillospiraceae bacterium]